MLNEYAVWVSDDKGQTFYTAKDRAAVVAIVRDNANRTGNTMIAVELLDGTPVAEFIKPSEHELRQWLKGV